MLHYNKYPLSRIISVQEIVSADYINTALPFSNLHAHQSAWEVCVCIAGEVLFQKDQHHLTLTEGQILLVQPGLDHDISLVQPDSSTIVVSFTCTNSEHLRPLQDTIFPADESQLSLFRSILREVRSAFESDSGDRQQVHLLEFRPNEYSPLGSEQMICCYLEQLLISLLRHSTMNQGQVVHSGQFKEAIQSYLAEQVAAYIQSHIGEHLTVAGIATHFHYSRAHLSAICKTYSGVSISQMITHANMQRAKELLLEQTLSVAQISELLGFSSPQYFSRKFSEEVGVPPSKYYKTALHNKPPVF